MTRGLTNQQQLIYTFIRDQIVSRGYGPTVREIGEHMNIKSPNGVICHLQALERKGVISRQANKSRAIELTEPISHLLGASLPQGGEVSGGACRLHSGSDARVDLASFCGAERFALRVRDDSLLEAHILNGDQIVVQPQPTASNGQLALVRTGDAETCLRYWIAEGAHIRLQPVQRGLPPTLVEHAEVLGIVTGVLRDLTLDNMGDAR